MGITGIDLIAMGFPPGPAFGAALEHISSAGLTGAALEAYVAEVNPAPVVKFGFRRGDLYYHARGATPVEPAFLPDTDGRQIVPLNMAAPIQIVTGGTGKTNLGFAPHGAGRNMSRTAHMKRQAGRSEADIFAEETAGLDVRFDTDNVDVSELPSAYKPAGTVAAQMKRFGLAEVVDEIRPHGSIMAGDSERDPPSRKKPRAKG